MAVLHVQHQRLALPLFGMLIGIAVTTMGLALWEGLPLPARAGVMVAAPLTLLILWAFERLSIVITDKELLAGFRLFRTRTALSEIERVDVIDIGLWRHGVGLHFNFSAWCFTARLSRGIRVQRRGRTTLVFSCDHPDELREALQRAGAAVDAAVSTDE